MWKHLFKPHILNRGFVYLNEGRLDNIQFADDIVTATVCGTARYKVIIQKTDSEILDMKCDCPHADDGHNCKHMAALLFYLEYRDRAVKKEENLKLTTKLVREADIELVRNFLITSLGENEKLLDKFKLKVGYPISPEDISHYKKQIDDMFWESEHEYEYDFFDDEDSWTTSVEITDLLEGTISEMVENGRYREAVDLANYIYVKTGNSQMDGSQGGKAMIAEACLEIWEETIYHCDSQLKKTMFQWFLDHMDGNADENMGNNIEIVLFELFNEKEFIIPKQEFLRAKMAEYRTKEKEWSRDYRLGQLALLYLDLLYEQRASHEEIKDFYERNLDIGKIKDRFIDQCLLNEDYEQAIALLKEAKEAENNKLWGEAKYSLQLKNVYKTIGEHKLYEEELWSLALNSYAVNLDLYKELRSLYSEDDWLGKRETIFTALSSHGIAYELLSFEKMYDRLLDLVVNSFELGKVLEYEGILMKIYPDELLQKYESELVAMASHGLGRSHYRKIVYFLKQMKKYPNGPEKVTALINNWRIKYKNRPAMMDELNSS